MKNHKSQDLVTSAQAQRIQAIAIRTCIIDPVPVTVGVLEFGIRFAEKYGYHSIVREMDDTLEASAKRILS